MNFTHIKAIRDAIGVAGGLDAFPLIMKKNRPVGCPRVDNMVQELKELSVYEIHLAFNMGLIGNGRRVGSIIGDCRSRLVGAGLRGNKSIHLTGVFKGRNNIVKEFDSLSDALLWVGLMKEKPGFMYVIDISI